MLISFYKIPQLFNRMLKKWTHSMKNTFACIMLILKKLLIIATVCQSSSSLAYANFNSVIQEVVYRELLPCYVAWSVFPCVYITAPFTFANYKVAFS